MSGIIRIRYGTPGDRDIDRDGEGERNVESGPREETGLGPDPGQDPSAGVKASSKTKEEGTSTSTVREKLSQELEIGNEEYKWKLVALSEVYRERGIK